MEETLSPAHHADHVGSLIRPDDLTEAWFAEEEGNLSGEELRKIQDRAIRDVVKLQEDIGLRYITDGEFRRGGWSRGFLNAVGGFEFRPSSLTFRNEEGIETAAPAPVAVRRLKRTKPIVLEDFKFLRDVTGRTPKVTMPTPSHMHFGHFKDAVDPRIYPDIDAYWNDLVQIYREEIADLAAAGCRHLQLDEVPLTLCCDETNRRVAEEAGEEPDRLVDTYIDVLNRAIAERPEDMEIVLHLCRGNMQGLWMGDGGYAPIAERLFNELEVDRYLMEYDSPRAGDFQPLSYLPKGKRVHLGLVSTKRADVEAPDALKRKIEEAAGYAPVEQLGICPQCGFGSSAMSKFNVLPNPVTLDSEKRKLELLIAVAEDVWV